MIKYFVESNHKIEAVDDIPSRGWISLTDPSDEELRIISSEFDLPPEVCRTALDLDERSRIEVDDGYRMLLINIPTREETSERELYTTIPLAIILAGECVITVCSKTSHILAGFENGKERDFHPGKRSRFVLQLLYATARRYLIYLRLIEKKLDLAEEEFAKKQKNRELLELMKLEKSLVYFTTGLKSNESVLEKLRRSDIIPRYEEDTDLLEDTIVENRQAIEMARINQEILTSMSNTFASVISNNLNVAMKALSMITVIMATPTMLFSAWGMNVGGIPLAENPAGFWIALGVAVVACVLTMLIMLKVRLFK